MRISTLSALAVCATALTAHAATPVYLTRDHSSNLVLDKAAAEAVWKQQLDDKTVARLAKLYPVRQWGFISEVEGGFNADKTCVITARVLMVPRSGKNLTFAPSKTATAFDAKPGATQDQCRDLGRAKLGEAITSITAALVAAR